MGTSPDGATFDARNGDGSGRSNAPRERLKWWHGALALVVGGIGAQLAGLVALVVGVAVTLSSRGMPAGPLEQAGQELIQSFWVFGPTVVVTGLSMVLVSFATPALAAVPVKRALALRGAPWPVFLAASIGILALGPTSDGMLQLMERFAPNFTIGTLESLSELARSAPLAAAIVVMAIVPGVSEELLFRGTFQRSIRRPRLAVVLSAVLFAAYHGDPHHVMAVLPLGFYLAWLGQRTGSVAVPVTAHVVNNAAAVIGSRYFVDPAVGETAPTEWWWIPVGWVVAALCIAVIAWRTRGPALRPGDAALRSA